MMLMMFVARPLLGNSTPRIMVCLGYLVSRCRL